jgi:hypothetical protein
MDMPRFKLLTRSNPKTAKGRAKGWAVAVLHLAPHTLGGRNVCPAATRGCIAACLNLAGRGGLMAGGALSHDDVATGRRVNEIQAARIRRTEWLYADRAGFLAVLRNDVLRFVAWCKREGFKPALRLNGTSDLDWNGMAPELMAEIAALGVVRYDYTKVANRTRRVSSDYRLTFSLAENNDAAAVAALRGGMNVAAVFTTRKGQPLPTTFTLAGETFPVIDGDDDDLRFLDPAGVIVGLRAKGPARRDVSGFVRAA